MDQPVASSHQIAIREAKRLPSPGGALALLWTFMALVLAGTIVYSQTWAFVWDEGFHLLAAQLIKAGRTPYLDFCFPQTPLNAYLNAGLMWVFGENWHVPQFAAALWTVGGLVLAVDYVVRYFPDRHWRIPCALVAVAFVGLNPVLMLYGVVAQAYGIGSFFCVAAFRMAIIAVRRRSIFLAFATGLLASVATGSTLLTAPVLPALLVWLALCSEPGQKLKAAAGFLVGSVVPFIPVILLWLRSPSVVFFNVVRYQAIFRRYHWNGATEQDIDVLSAWLDSTPALLLVLLTIAGAWFLVRGSGWSRQEKREIYLAGALGLSLTLYIATAHPTFERYFVFAIPFLSIVAITGLYATGRRLVGDASPFWPATTVTLLLILAAARSLFEDREGVRWSDYENMANKVAKVTPRAANLYADELIYFLLSRTPPPGMEFSYSHKLELSPAEESKYHLVSERELNEQVKAGRFATVQSCNDDRIAQMKLPELFARKEEVGDCTIFWDFKGTKKPAAGKP